MFYQDRINQDRIRIDINYIKMGKRTQTQGNSATNCRMNARFGEIKNNMFLELNWKFKKKTEC